MLMVVEAEVTAPPPQYNPTAVGANEDRAAGGAEEVVGAGATDRAEDVGTSPAGQAEEVGTSPAGCMSRRGGH